ncbi:hypothetical protein L6452_09331 [Arctium lappa]|uniref:Uncharacterized protein n=1 Tax=Arctium lappa TaxID=4217 RepID=A0ACB9DJP6_ARCLA|nr:hypothetical protein L6452_09331 [Arctium lappa]
MMVDVVGAHEVDGDHGHDDLDSKTGSVRLVQECMQKETETYDANMDTEEAAGSGEDVCHFEKVEVTVKEEGLKRSLEASKDVQDSDRVLTIEKVEVAVKEEGLKRSLEASKDVQDSDRVLTIEKVEVAVKEEEGLKRSLEASKDVLQDSVRVLTIEKVEVVVKGEGLKRNLEVSGDVLQDSEGDAQKSGTCVRDSELAFESSRVEPQSGGGDIAVIDSKELMERGTEVVVEQNVESVEEVAGGDRAMDGRPGKEAQILDSSKIAESSTTTAELGSGEVDMIVVEEGLASKDEAQDGVSVDPSLVCDNNQNSSTELVNAGTDEVAGRSKEESLHPTIGVITDDSHRRENGLIDMEEESERGLSKEIMEQPIECDQQVTDGDCIVDEKIGKATKALDSLKIVEPSITTNFDSEDVDVVVDEGLASKGEAQDGVSVDASLVCADNRSLSTGEDDVNVQAENLDQQAEVDKLSKNQSFHPTTEVITNDAQTPENGPVVGDSKLAIESSNGEPQYGGETAVKDREETGRGLTEDDETVEQHTESVQEVTYGDGVMDEKTGNGDEVLDSSKIPVSLTTANLGPEEVLTTKVEAQDSDSVGPRLVCPDNRSLSTEVVNAFEEVSGVAPCADVAKDCVLHEDLEFSYEDAHMERGEDAGMDIDEVLGWKDEMPEIDVLSGNADHPETDQDFKINADSEGGVEQGLPESSCEPVIIGQPEENCKSRQPIVYERRVHVEVPLYDSLDGSRSPLLEDENLKVETDSEEDDESVQEEEKKAVGRSTNEVTEPLENESSCSLQQSCYFRPREKGQFSVSDLVWGKIRSHPWWPGQIFNPSDASEKAMRYHKKDCFLVAYFGDGTFAWNDSAVLKPFRPKFSQIEKNTNSEAFKNAVRCALEEVSRRVELGLACSCVPQEIYETIEYQNVENGGIRQKSNRRPGVDESAGVSSFEPDKLVDYARLLARFPGEGDKMELAMAKAQLSSYSRYKGYRKLPEFQFYGDILEEDASMLSEGVEQVNDHGAKISEKFENNLMDGEYPNKDRSLSDLTDDTPYSGDGDRTEGGNVTSSLVSSSGLKKRKARDSISNGSKKRPSPRLEKVPSALISTPKPSFKVGECIQRVASQLTGPPSVLKSNSDANGLHADQLVGPAVSLQTIENSETERMIVESKQSSVADMLSQLHLVAQDPMKGYSFLNTIIPFFYDRRTAVFSKSIRQNSSIGRPVSGKKRKTSNENEPEEFEFEFDDVNDSYWTDRIIQNHSEEQLLQDKDNQNEGQECHVVAYEPEKPAKASRRSNKKRVVSSNHEIESKEQSELVERRRQNLATEVILKFAEGRMAVHVWSSKNVQMQKLLIVVLESSTFLGQSV